MRTLIKKKLEEYKNSIIIEKKFIEKNYQLNENFIKINRLKAAVKLLNPSNIVNLKRKVIDIDELIKCDSMHIFIDMEKYILDLFRVVK